MDDPFTLIMAPSQNNSAEGFIYRDDGETLKHQENCYLLSEMEMTQTNHEIILKGSPSHPIPPLCKSSLLITNKLEEIVVLGQKSKPLSVRNERHDLEYRFSEDSGALHIKSPGIRIDDT
eukprot:TRINITY_DN18349_c0_g3_i1.p1 TRINITY_DN18349_c0_g3~~TRINITY_DN18349_c0_g3_i1.p1  ORF type:complete len:120 (+),score=15.27 TRINITY_DN18349_c0_g3_i1:1-360(+)